MSRFDLAAGVNLTVVALWLAGIVGWLLNLGKLVASIGDPLGTLFVARCVGVLFAPLGAVLGYF